MSEADLLAEILRAPDDDRPRLILADYLTERGDPRGELIQLQVRAAALESGGERNKVRAAENKLLEAHEEAWIGPIVHFVEKAEFRRGFISMVRMTARAFVDHAEEVFAAAPLVDDLQLVFAEEGAPLAVEAFARPELGRIRTLCLRGADPRSVQALAGSTVLRSLRTLFLEGVRLGQAEGDAMARAELPSLKTLRILVAGDLALEAEVLAAIGRGRFVLESLHVDGQEWTPSPTTLGVPGAEAIAKGRAFASLKRLELPYTGLDADAVAVLTKIKTLEALDVTRARIGPDGLGPLFAHERLREVVLFGNELGDAGAIRIAKSPALARWVSLHLGANDIGIDGVKAIADSRHARNLETLNLAKNRLRDRAIDVLLASENLANAKIWIKAFLARKKVPINVERSLEKKAERAKAKARAKKPNS